MALPKIYNNVHLLLDQISVLIIRHYLDNKCFHCDLVFTSKRLIERGKELGWDTDAWKERNSPYKIIYYNNNTNNFEEYDT